MAKSKDSSERQTKRPTPRESGTQGRRRDQGPSDATDIALLAALRDDGRATVQNLAAKVGVSHATASVRIQALRNAGLVRGVHARVDYAALGFSLCNYILLEVSDITGERGAFTEQVLSFPEVEEMAWVTGDHDVIVKVWTRDTKHLEALVVRIDELGARSKTMLVLGEPQVKPGITFEAPATTLDR
jgi:Lrp/AsnC family leucine-responsive transcriptional regulator